jgi:hypothetical protein
VHASIGAANSNLHFTPLGGSCITGNALIMACDCALFSRGWFPFLRPSFGKIFIPVSEQSAMLRWQHRASRPMKVRAAASQPCIRGGLRPPKSGSNFEQQRLYMYQWKSP